MKPVESFFKCFRTSSPLLVVSLTLSACGSGQNLSDPVALEPGAAQSLGQEPLTVPAPAVISEPEAPSVSAPLSVPETEAASVSVSLPETETPTEPMPVPMQVAEPQPPAVPLAQSEPESETLNLIVLDDVSCGAEPEVIGLALVELTNQSRQVDQVCGNTAYEAALPLQWDESLSEAAFKHSNDMATHNFFSHTGSDGSAPSQRTMAAGFPTGTIGENIAAGQRTTGSAQNGWMESPGHCTNIMRPGYTHMGASCVEDAGADFQRYWTVVFGRK